MLDAGSSISIKVDDSQFAGWKKLELYQGATKVAELTKGPAEFTVNNLKAGYHVFTVLGTDAGDRRRPSNQVLVERAEMSQGARPEGGHERIMSLLPLHCANFTFAPGGLSQMPPFNADSLSRSCSGVILLSSHQSTPSGNINPSRS